jgi:hypothetical protein
MPVFVILVFSLAHFVDAANAAERPELFLDLPDNRQMADLASAHDFSVLRSRPAQINLATVNLPDSPFDRPHRGLQQLDLNLFKDIR